ncbi:MAG: hypothetical protein Q7V88_05615, partial [Actinomycetota bacterium]|nr:hypothetical protein [Actinomycetota bacterium]
AVVVVVSALVGCGDVPALQTLAAGRAPSPAAGSAAVLPPVADTVPNAVPNDTTPNDTNPNDTVPADTIPNDAVPAGTIPGDTVPGDTVPGDTAPVDDGSGSFGFIGPPVCAPPASTVRVVLQNTTPVPQDYHWMNLLHQSGQPVFQVVLLPSQPMLIAVAPDGPLIWPPVGPETLAPGESVELALVTPSTEGEYVLEMVHISRSVTLTVSVANQCVDSWVLPSSA